MPYVVTDTCISCGACVAGCDSDAITEGETQSHIDISICVECGTCERNCPTDSIIFIDDAEYARMNSQTADSPAVEPPSQPAPQPVRNSLERATDHSIGQSPFL